MLKKILFLVLVTCILSRIALASFSISVDYPNEIQIERGWIKYFNVIITNNGDDLHNLTISFNGEFPQWFETGTNETELPNSSNASFLAKLSVPNSTESRTYSFILNINSKEISETKTFTVRAFNSEVDALLYQVQQLQDEIDDVQANATIVEKSGKNVTGVKSTLTEAQNYLIDSKNYINKEEYENVSALMINAADSIKEAEYDLSIAPPNTIAVVSSTTFSFELPLILVLIILLVIVFYLGFIKKKKEPLAARPFRATPPVVIQPATQTKEMEPITQPITKIKEKIFEGRDSSKLEDELKDFENSLNLLEEEFKESLITKESYDELKAKYEKRISDLKEEIERNRKV